MEKSLMIAEALKQLTDEYEPMKLALKLQTDPQFCERQAAMSDTVDELVAKIRDGLKTGTALGTKLVKKRRFDPADVMP